MSTVGPVADPLPTEKMSPQRDSFGLLGLKERVRRPRATWGLYCGGAWRPDACFFLEIVYISPMSSSKSTVGRVADPQADEKSRLSEATYTKIKFVFVRPYKKTK